MYQKRGNQKQIKIGITVVVLIAAVTVFFMFTPEPQVKQESGYVKRQTDKLASNLSSVAVVTGEIKKQTPIDYKDLEKDEPLKTMMTDRKKSLGIQKSLDMIVKSDETFTIGKSTVSMQKILEQAFTEQGKVYQAEISEFGTSKPSQIREYGIYVVQSGDNIWNIHFRILKDYYGAKGIRLEELADEPGTGGMSSGVGKILKFSETMVIIYNMIEEKVTQDINIIDPLSKIVVYNMDAVFSLLEEITFNNVDRLQFDGKNIWIPAQKS